MPALLPLNDRCYLGTESAGTDGEPTPTYSYATGTAVPCAVINIAPSTAMAEDGLGLQLPNGAVRIAFRRDASVSPDTRIQVYRRLRQTLAASEYYIVDGEPRVVRNRLVAMCRRTNARAAR